MNFSTGTRVCRLADGVLGNVVSDNGETVTCVEKETGAEFTCGKDGLKTMRGRPRKMITAVVAEEACEAPACDAPVEAEACAESCETPCCDAE